MKTRHNILIKRLDQAIENNFGYCDSEAHKIIEELEELEAEMKQKGLEFNSYHNR